MATLSLGSRLLATKAPASFRDVYEGVALPEGLKCRMGNGERMVIKHAAGQVVGRNTGNIIVADQAIQFANGEAAPKLSLDLNVSTSFALDDEEKRLQLGLLAITTNKAPVEYTAQLVNMLLGQSDPETSDATEAKVDADATENDPE